MSEIKSTLDLIMERTTGMSLSKEEMDSLHLEDLRKNVMGFKLRMLDDPDSVDVILATVRKESDRDRLTIESLLWREMIDSLPPDIEGLKYLNLMVKLPGARTKLHLLKDAKALLKGAAKGSSVDRKKLINRERKRLASAGISGSAVIPNPSFEIQPDSSLLSALKLLKEKLFDDIDCPD